MLYFKKSIILVLLLSMLVSICGCKEKQDERVLSLFELKYSDEAVAELEIAYKKKLKGSAAFDISDATVEMHWNGVNPNDGGGMVYYGTFGDCTVWVLQMNTEGIEDFKLAGSRFYNRNGISFFVCRNGELIMLEEAYAQGFISADDIAIIAQRHLEFLEACGEHIPPETASR